jgi:hypothetical protein
MSNLPLKPIADAKKLTAILAKNLKIVDAYVQRRQEMTQAVQALEGQKDSVETESKDALMQQKLELEEELPQHLGRIRAVADHLSRALLDELHPDMTEAVARLNSVINRLYVIRSTVGARCFAQSTIDDTMIPSPVDGRDLFKPPLQKDCDGHVIEAAWEQDGSAVALYKLLQPYYQTERQLEQLYFEQRESAAADRRGV